MRVTVSQIESAPRGSWEQYAPNRLPPDLVVYYGEVAYSIEYTRENPSDPGYCWVRCNRSNVCYFPDFKQLEVELRLAIGPTYSGRLRDVPYPVRLALHNHFASLKSAA